MLIASVEDDPIQANLVKQTLTQSGHQVEQFVTGKEFLSALNSNKNRYNLFLLDWELPDVTGVELLVWIRNNIGPQVPIIFVTNRTEDADLLQAFQLGADDYINKPFSPAILSARVNANLRRNTATTQVQSEVVVGPYRFDNNARKVYLHGEPIVLAPKEFELASLFFRNIGRLFSRDALSSTIWNREIPATSRTLDTHLSNVRQKLKIHPENGVQIVASYALGYRLELVQE
ncbi:response regulator transcription factor [Pelistega sp. MC2]|uniref:response regulator transcription factor n=1 Tax=Pelistega sp. MC2 TaxID=1720297 RepID=UPI0008DA8038|nr:response regulator transcription factor [Pelistega sp. MC2]